MSLTQNMSLKLMEVQMNVVPSSNIDPCLVENSTRGVTNSLLANVTNFVYGTGLTIVIIMFVLGVLLFIFGKGTWIKAAGGGIIILIFLPAIIEFARGAVPGGNC